jgi:hypothetical protein
MPPISPGARVRIKPNDCAVPAGSEGIVLRIHPDSGLPVVRTETGRPVAFLIDQLEVLAMPTIEVPAVTKSPNGIAERYDWTAFDPRASFVTLSAGAIRLSAAASEWLAGVEKGELLYDRGHGAIGLRQAPGSSGRAIPLRSNTAGTSVTAREFMRLVDLSGTGKGKPARCPARWDTEAGVLVITGVPFRKDGA